MLANRNLHVHVLRLYTLNIMYYAYAHCNNIMVTIMVTKRAWTILSPHVVMQEVLAKCRVKIVTPPPPPNEPPPPIFFLNNNVTNGDHLISLFEICQYVSPPEKVLHISYVLTLTGKIFITQICLSRVNDCIEDMVTFTALAKIYSTKYFCNVARLSEIFNFHVYTHTMYSSSD